MEQNAAQDARWRMQIVKDDGLNGMEAFALLVPAEWNVSGGTYWQMSPVMPCLVNLRVVGRQGQKFEILPSMAFSSGMGTWMFPQGSSYMGTEVLNPPANWGETLRMILDRFRAGVSNVHVMDFQTSANAMPYANMQASNSLDFFACVEYEESGHVFREEFHWRVVNSGVVWSVERIYARRAPAGVFDGNRKLLLTIHESLRVNPAWIDAVARVSDMACRQQINHINQIGQLSRYIVQTYNDISNLSMSSWQYKMQSDDRVDRQWGEYMRGVNTWYDPYRGVEVQFPNTYRYGWVNSLGEYVFTDSASYNPNVGDNRSWSRME